ncbi:rna-directed dna polymerase from mobile element jockey-like [Limosa lapponica baueri]|uniref:Rna-directed dna polymerase from mobile element jockey-like n=1 Tax=Limosa lapponica baueri TaxID=1758121 RepID=A0A2I0T6U5_LIMLA|nr:rna-directed dna polymerase from mobile element jockey-like [Limosa lapponica baueri]
MELQACQSDLGARKCYGADHIECHHAVRTAQTGDQAQHGFMKGRFSLTKLISFYDKENHLVDGGRAVDVVYLNFSKAFGTISHSILKKLAAHGLDGCTLRWVKNRLDIQAKRVVVNRVKSSWSRGATMNIPNIQY